MKKIIRKINQRGYTLAELAISTSILAMLAVGGLSIMGKKNEADNLKETYTKLEKIESALESFINVNRYVPCPAGPRLDSSSQFFGYSVAYNNVLTDLLDSDGNPGPDGYDDEGDYQECDNDALDDGTGDTDIDDSGDTTGDLLGDVSTGEFLFAGAVPVRTLGLPDDYMYDGWDRKFTYRIAKGAGAAADFDVSTFNGDIGIMDRKGIHKTDINNLPPNNNGAIYVIISHGSNGKDVAWGKNAATVPVQATGVEGQNTNHSSKNYIQSPKTETFDDIVEFGLKKDVIQPYNVTSPVDISPITCENATELVENGRTSLNSFATSVGVGGDSLADQIYNNALVLSSLCDSAPTEIRVPSSFRGLVLWLDANDNNTVHEVTSCDDPAEDGEQVDCWQDKSDNGNDAGPTGSSGPTYDTAAMNQRNVLVTSTHHLKIPDSPSLDSVQNSTFFFVGDIANVGTGGASSVIFNKRPTSGTIHFQYLIDSLRGQQFVDSASTAIYSEQQVPTGRPLLYTWQLSVGQPVTFYLDGEVIETSAQTVNGSFTTNDNDAYLFSHSTGSSFYLDAKVGEIVLYNTTLSNQEKSAIEVYLSDKWSIELNNTNSELCPPGMEFIRDHEHPEGACQCITDDNYLVQELSSGSACLFGENTFNKCSNISDNAPNYSNPPSSSGQILWLDSNDCTTITLSDSDGSVSTWADKSPNEFDATSSGANMPEFKKDNVNGLDTIEFDGVDEFLTLGSNYLYSTNDGLNLFAVAQSNKTANDGYVFDFGQVNSSTGYGISFIRNAIDSYASSSGNTAQINDLNKLATDYAILHLNIDFDDTITESMDGTTLQVTSTTLSQLTSSQINANPTRVPSGGPVTIGTQSRSTGDTNSYHSGNIGEVIVYDKKLTTNEALAVEDYLSDKWAINNSPDDISTLQLWFDASDISTLYTDSCGSTLANSDDDIACWDNKVTGNNDAVQGTSGNRPILDIDAITVGSDSMPALDFESGSSDVMTITDQSAFDITENLSVFVVFNPDVDSSNAGVFTKYFSSTNMQYGFHIRGSDSKLVTRCSNAGASCANETTTGVNEGGTTNPGDGDTYIYNFTLGSGSTPAINNYLNGQSTGVPATTNGAATIASVTTTIEIGDGGGWLGNYDGQIAEILFFSSVLSVSEREYIEQYLGSKWGVTINQ